MLTRGPVVKFPGGLATVSDLMCDLSCVSYLVCERYPMSDLHITHERRRGVSEGKRSREEGKEEGGRRTEAEALA